MHTWECMWDEVAHKNTHICLWNLYLIELSSAFSLRLSNLLHKLLPLSSSSDLFLDFLVYVEIYTLCRRCRQGREDAMVLLLTFIITSVILAITWPPRKCFECHILLLSLTSRTYCYMWSSLWWLISATVPLLPTKLLMMPRCLTSCCYWEQNNFKYDHLIWVSKRQQTDIIKREREKRHIWPLNPGWNS